MKLGFMVDNLRGTQQNFYMIQAINRFVRDSRNDSVVFFETPSIPCVPTSFAVMQMVEAYSYDGVMVATNFHLARKLLKYPGPIRKIFYVWELEWMGMKDVYHHELINVYANNGLRLVTRSERYASILQSVWNLNYRPEVVKDFEFKEAKGI